MSFVTGILPSFKCARCIAEFYERNTIPYVPEHILKLGEPADDAITVFDGKAYCLRHFREKLEYSKSWI